MKPLLLFLAALPSGRALAQPAVGPVGPVEALIEKGVGLRLQGLHAEALEFFRQAHTASPSARTLAQMGLAQFSLKRWVDAEGHVSSSLGSHDTPWIENAANRGALEKALRVIRSHVGLVTIEGVEGMEVFVDGRHVGKLPMAEPVHVDEGSTTIAGEVAGRRRASVTLEVLGGRAITARVDVPNEEPLPPASAPVLHQRGGAKSEPPLVHLGSLGPGSEKRSWKIWGGGGLLVASLAAVTAGVVLLAIDNKDYCDSLSGSRCLRIRDTKVEGLVALSLGVVSGVGGGILIWQGRRSAAISVGPGSVTGRF